jgi:large subunit ribosomal protein L30
MMSKIIVKQIRSKIGSTKRQKRTLEALGLKKINSTVEIQNSPELLGMVNKVKHLVDVQEINE